MQVLPSSLAAPAGPAINYTGVSMQHQQQVNGGSNGGQPVPNKRIGTRSPSSGGTGSSAGVATDDAGRHPTRVSRYTNSGKPQQLNPLAGQQYELNLVERQHMVTLPYVSSAGGAGEVTRQPYYADNNNNGLATGNNGLAGGAFPSTALAPSQPSKSRQGSGLSQIRGGSGGGGDAGSSSNNNGMGAEGSISVGNSSNDRNNLVSPSRRRPLPPPSSPAPLPVAPGTLVSVPGCIECGEVARARLDEPVLLMEDRHAAGVFGSDDIEWDGSGWGGGVQGSSGIGAGGGGGRKQGATWRLRERTKTFNVGLIICLNIGELSILVVHGGMVQIYFV